MITAQQIKELRDKTGNSVSACKKALEEAGGDREKLWLFCKKASNQPKKSGQDIRVGVIEAYAHYNKKVGVILELKANLILCLATKNLEL